MDLSINNVRLFDGAEVKKGLFSVGIVGNKITSVGSSTAQAGKEIDAAGRFLMPGLIDCHIHLLNMWTATDEQTMAADIEHEMPKRLEDFLAAGVTAVKSVGDSEDDILRVRAMLEGVNSVAPDYSQPDLRSLLPAVILPPPFMLGIPGFGAARRSNRIRHPKHGLRCGAWPRRR